MKIQKLFKIILNSTLATSLVVTPTFSKASEVDDIVDKSIRVSFERAKDDASAMIADDVGKMSQKMMEQLAKYAKSQEIFGIYSEMVADLQREFKALAVLNADTEITEATVKRYMARYEAAVRKRFVASWAPYEQQREYEIARNMMVGLAQDFKNTCRIGRGMKNWSYLSPSIQPPGYINRFSVNIGPNFLAPFTGGIPFNISYGFQSGTGGSEAANRDRSRFVAVTTTASNIANSIWLGSKFTALMASLNTASTTAAATTTTAAGGSSLMGSFAAGMIAAAPYLAAVAVITMVVVSFVAKAEASRLNNELQSALIRQGLNTADVETVNQYYREGCKVAADALDKVAQMFLDLENPAKRSVLVADAESKQSELQAWEKASESAEKAACLGDLGHLFEKENCQQLSANQSWGDLKPDPKNPKTLCAIDVAKQNIFAINRECFIPYEENARKEVLKTAQDEVKKFNSDFPPEKVVDLMIARMTVLFQDQDALRAKWQSTSMQSLDQLQSNAFAKMMKLIGMLQELRAKANNSDELNSERRIQTQFFSYRKELVELTASLIRSVAGVENKKPLIKRLVLLQRDYSSFADRYRHVPEVKSLSATIDEVVRTAKDL